MPRRTGATISLQVRSEAAPRLIARLQLRRAAVPPTVGPAVPPVAAAPTVVRAAPVAAVRPTAAQAVHPAAPADLSAVAREEV